jgi:hypothetical protein
MKRAVVLLVILCIAGLSTPVRGASPEAYLPLQEGLVWEFQHKFFDLQTKDQVGSAKSIKKNLAPTTINGTRVYPQEYLFYQPEGTLKQKTIAFIAPDPQGYYVFARQSEKENKPKIVGKTFFVLKLPIQKGTSWQQEEGGLTIQNTIESIDETVQVSAGKFTNCLLMKKVYFHKQDSKKPVQEALFWFAPEVGNVKILMQNFQLKKEMHQELISFKK